MKSLYNPDIHPNLVKGLCEQGFVDAEIAKKIGVSRSTFYQWQNAHPEFAAVINKAKIQSDDAVEAAVYKRALGYDVPYEETEVKETKDGTFTTVKTGSKHIPGDVTAEIFWLKNRRPGKWRDKQDHEHTGPGGGPIKIENTPDLSLFTDEELAAMRAIHERANTRCDKTGTGAT